MRKNLKRTVLALMMVSMLASSVCVVPAFAEDVNNDIAVVGEAESSTTGLPQAVDGVIVGELSIS